MRSHAERGNEGSLGVYWLSGLLGQLASPYGLSSLRSNVLRRDARLVIRLRLTPTGRPRFAAASASLRSFRTKGSNQILSLRQIKKGRGSPKLGSLLVIGIDSLRSPLRGAYASLRRLRHFVPFERRVQIKSSLSAK